MCPVESGVTPPAIKDPSLIGKYENKVFGTVTITETENNTTFEYRNHKWTLNRKDIRSAEFVMTGFGLQIPISVYFEVKDNRISQLSFPLSLDPTAPSQIFIRT